MKLKAFTLAEVLIVLAIVGIVAILTIPTLMTDMQQRRFETAFKKAINTLENNNKTLLTAEDTNSLSNICGENYIAECLAKTTTLSYVEDSGMYITKDGISLKQLGTGTDSNASDLLTGKYYEVLIDVNGAKSPNNLCQDQYKVWVDYNGLVTDVSGCDSEYGEYTTSSEDTEQGTTTEEESNEAEHEPESDEPFSDTAVKIGDYWVDKGADGWPGVIDCTNTSSEDYKYCEGITTSDVVWELRAAQIKICDEQGARVPTMSELKEIYQQSNNSLLDKYSENYKQYAITPSIEGKWYTDSTTGKQYYNASCYGMSNGWEWAGGCGYTPMCIK